jgi:hypothetical protein
MKRTSLASAILGLGLMFLVPPPAAMAQLTDTDEFQRRFTFYNQLSVPIYPVIQAPNDSNCATVDSQNYPKGALLRILVNAATRGGGIPAGGSATVAIPKTAPCPPKGGFYDSSRIFIFTASVEALEARLLEGQRTQEIKGVDFALECAACWVGKASLDYGPDGPGQLLEYTIISQGPSGAAIPDSSCVAPNNCGANNTLGTPFIDFDVSYVDDAYLPVTMATAGGTAQFMGSTLAFADQGGKPGFNSRLTAFLKDGKWSRYAAFSDLNWNTTETSGNPRLPNRTIFADLVPSDLGRTDKLPSANILVTNVQNPSGEAGVSGSYKPSWDGSYPRECKPDPPNQNKNLNCSAVAGLVPPNNTYCCPQFKDDNTMLGCCDSINFLIDRQKRTWVIPEGTEPAKGHWEQHNDTRDDLVSRWVNWATPTENPCLVDKVVQEAPVLDSDKKSFCANFNKTVDFVWNQFKSQCGQVALQRDVAAVRGTVADTCVVSKIIGYDVKTDDNFKNLCGKCPTECPTDPCLVEIQRNESVQALMRGVPWTPAGDAQTCGACPGRDCPKKCIFPEEALPAGVRLWHRDGFLHFWPPYSSEYNLNPFARFVHNFETGLAAPGAYSFSIDDFYGNFGGPGSTLIIEVGGTSHMPNREPYNPYKQYFVAWGKGWDHAKVCNRRIKNASQRRNAPFSFWQDGKQSDTCEVFLYPSKDESKFLTFRLTEARDYDVVDSYTGLGQRISGLAGVYAQRPGTPVATNNKYCEENSAADPTLKLACNANLTSAGGDTDLPVNTAYVSVSDKPCDGLNFDDPKYFTCGKPLIHLNIGDNHPIR